MKISVVPYSVFVTLVLLYIVDIEGSSTTPPSIKEVCDALNKDCSTCLGNSKCLWCDTNGVKSCVPYPVGELIPKKDVCPLGDARWGVCWMNYKALLISMGVIAGVIILMISCCCIYCCCCRSKAKRQARYAAEDARIERERAERESRNAERRAERQSKYDEIRKKYGLTKDDGYKRFENE